MRTFNQLVEQCGTALSPGALERRQEVAEALRLLPWTHQGAAGNLALKALAEGAPLLTTGQQAGLALGPALVLWKSLALLCAADRVEEKTGQRPVTVMWLEGNDHDWSEASHAHWPLQETPAAPAHLVGRSVGRMELDAQWWQKAQACVQIMGMEEGDPLLAHWQAACGGTLVEHSARLLQGLLANKGLICLDPSQPALRALAAPFLKELATEREALARCVQDDTVRLAAAGLPTPVLTDEHALLFGEDSLGRRKRLHQEDPLPHDDALSPSALGRVLLQDWLLTPAAAFLGPTERAYHGQVESARARLGLSPVLQLPRPHLQLARGGDVVAWRDAGADPWFPPRPGQAWPLELLEGLPGGAAMRKDLQVAEQLEEQWRALCGNREGAFPALTTRHSALAAQLRQALVEAHKSAHKSLLKSLHARALWQDGDLPQERRVNTLALVHHMGGVKVVEHLLQVLDPFAPGQQRVVLGSAC